MLDRTLELLILLAQDTGAPPLDEETRARAMGSVFGILLAGLFLLVLIMLGAHMVRRRLRRQRAAASKTAPDDNWYQKPLDEANDPPPST